METIKTVFYSADNKKGRFLMRKVISLISDYFLTLIVGFAIGMFICIQYFDSINLIAGERFFVSKETIVLGIFHTLPVMFFLLPFALMLYKIRHKDNPAQSFITFVCLSLLNWFIFYPVTLKLQNIAEKNFSEKNANLELKKLTSGYFRQSGGKLYFFSKEPEPDSADVILLENRAEPLDFAKEEKLDLSRTSEFYRNSSPFRDPLAKDTMNDIPYHVINIFHSIKFQAIRAWNYGLISWLCFCSLGFALCSLYSLIKLSSWRMINALSALFFTGILIWFNDFYFSPMNSGMRNFLHELFYESGKLNFFIVNGIDFPLMLINLLFGLTFTATGIVIAILRNKKQGRK